MPTALSARLAEVERRFVDLWGTMSSLWGINPTMARIHGLLYITGEALTMDDMMERLGISRGNVSMNLTNLVEWGLLQRGPPTRFAAGPLCLGIGRVGNVHAGSDTAKATGDRPGADDAAAVSGCAVRGRAGTGREEAGGEGTISAGGRIDGVFAVDGSSVDGVFGEP